MPSSQRTEKEKKIKLIKSAEKCHKLTNIFKLPILVSINDISSITILNGDNVNNNKVNSNSEIIIRRIEDRQIVEPGKNKNESQKQLSQCPINESVTEYLKDFNNVCQRQSDQISDICKYKILKHNYLIESDYEFKI